MVSRKEKVLRGEKEEKERKRVQSGKKREKNIFTGKIIIARKKLSRRGDRKEHE